MEELRASGAALGRAKAERDVELTEAVTKVGVRCGSMRREAGD